MWRVIFSLSVSSSVQFLKLENQTGRQGQLRERCIGYFHIIWELGMWHKPLEQLTTSYFGLCSCIRLELCPRSLQWSQILAEQIVAKYSLLVPIQIPSHPGILAVLQLHLIFSLKLSVILEMEVGRYSVWVAFTALFSLNDCF